MSKPTCVVLGGLGAVTYLFLITRRQVAYSAGLYHVCTQNVMKLFSSSIRGDNTQNAVSKRISLV